MSVIRAVANYYAQGSFFCDGIDVCSLIPEKERH